jgi:homoserine kinase type II
LDPATLAALLDTWNVAAPRRLSPLAHGTNNLMLRLESPGGDYVLRVYANHADLERLHFEHAVLSHLQAAHLPFAVPAPLPTSTGEYYARAATESGEALATLTHLIPGQPPRRDDLQQARAAGAAIALLDGALGQIESAVAGQGVSWRSFGDLAHCHPLVPDPAAALGELPVPPDARRRLVQCYEWLMARIPGLYADLPQQLSHEDTDPGNLLMEGDRVTGVLDFEFCSRDLRAMDLTVALSWWPIAHFGTGDEWPIIEALAQGCAVHLRLDEAEIEAMPVLFALRGFTSLIHRLGRHRQGLSPLEAVTDRAHAALEREKWLQENDRQLGETIGKAFAR